MANFKECELNDNLQEYQNENKIEIRFEEGFEGKIVLEEATVKYNYQNGYIYIKGKNGNFKINTALVYGYENKDGEVKIDLNTIIISIKILND